MIMRFLIFVLILCPLSVIGVFQLKDAFPMMIAQDRHTFISATIVACSIIFIFAVARFVVLRTEESASSHNDASFANRSFVKTKSSAKYSSSTSSHLSARHSYNSSSDSSDHLLIHAAVLSVYDGSSHSNDSHSCHDTTSSVSSDSSCSASSD